MLTAFFTFYVGIRTLLVPCVCCKNGSEAIPFRYTIYEKFRLPDVIVESSGLIPFDNGFLTINDSGGNNTLYQLDSAFNLTDSILITNASNNDWEDLAYRDSVIFIGDFGNNNNTRKNLVVYKYYTSDGRNESIRFAYPDQQNYPPSRKQNMNYDCEAFFYLNDSLYLFSKNIRNDTINIYTIPSKKGNYTATLKGKIILNEKITSADVDKNGQTIVLLTYGKWYLYTINTKITPVYCRKFGRARQSEAVCFDNNDNIVITNEQRQVFVFRPYKKKK
jgi:hypothetical protein